MDDMFIDDIDDMFMLKMIKCLIDNWVVCKYVWTICLCFICSGERPPILPNILYNIGNTPLVRINRITQKEGIKCELCRWKDIN